MAFTAFNKQHKQDAALVTPASAPSSAPAPVPAPVSRIAEVDGAFASDNELRKRVHAAIGALLSCHGEKILLTQSERCQSCTN